MKLEITGHRTELRGLYDWIWSYYCDTVHVKWKKYYM